MLVAAEFIFVSCDNNSCEDNVTRNGKQIEYYSNGKKRVEMQMKECLCFGEIRYYYMNGELKALGNCIKGKNDGVWRFYDLNGDLASAAIWDRNSLRQYSIYFKNGDSIKFDNGAQIVTASSDTLKADSSIAELFNNSTEVYPINENLVIVSNYRHLVLLTSNLKIKFNLDSIEQNEFWSTYSKRIINLETQGKFLKDGIDFSVDERAIKLTIYYRDDSNTMEPKSKEYEFPIV